MEMTGLNPDTDRIIEVALVVTDADLNTVAEAPVWVVHQEDAAHALLRAFECGFDGPVNVVAPGAVGLPTAFPSASTTIAAAASTTVAERSLWL